MNESVRLSQITQLLQQKYGTPNLGQNEELVSILSSEKTGESMEVEACGPPDGAVDAWEDVAHAREEHGAPLLTVADIVKKRALLIRSALVFIIKRYGGLKMPSFRRQRVRQAERKLIAIPEWAQRKLDGCSCTAMAGMSCPLISTPIVWPFASESFREAFPTRSPAKSYSRYSRGIIAAGSISMRLHTRVSAAKQSSPFAVDAL